MLFWDVFSYRLNLICLSRISPQLYYYTSSTTQILGDRREFFFIHLITKSTKWMYAQWRLRSVDKDPRFLHAESEDSDQTGRCLGWSEYWVLAGRWCHCVGFVMRRNISLLCDPWEEVNTLNPRWQLRLKTSHNIYLKQAVHTMRIVFSKYTSRKHAYIMLTPLNPTFI